jgi:predicted amidohydrolase
MVLSSSMRVALVQLAPRLGEVDANVARAGELVDEAVSGGADLVVLPECALSGYAVTEVEAATALRRDDPRLRDLSSRAGTAALVVGFHERSDDGRTHSSMAWFEGGAVVALHRKLFLAGGRWDEARRFAPGDELAAFDSGLGRAAMLVCNDAWHPVAPWLAARDGAELIVISAASADPLPAERLDIASTWDDVVRGVARLLQVIVVFVNRSGAEAGLHYWGGSRVVDPWGAELGRAGRGEGLTVVDVDPGSVAIARAELDICGDPRLGVVASSIARLNR